MRDVKSAPGSLRAERAAATRARIEQAARRAFAERGYAAVTLREIAAGADVAVQTVYAVFGSKASILRSLRASVVSDPEADAAWAAALASPGTRPALRAFAHSIRVRWEHGADVVAIDGDAARADPAIAAELDGAMAARRAGIARLAASLVRRDPSLPPAPRVAAALEAVTLPEAWLLLTEPSGWTPDEYEAWLAATLDTAVRRA